MKKLDINDLVVSKAEREDLFNRFKNRHGHFNAEALFGAIIEQQKIEKPVFPPRLSNFDSNLKAQDEILNKKDSKNKYFDLRRTSNLQFEHQFLKAQQVLGELKKTGAEGKNIVKQKGGALTRDQLIS